MKLASANSVFAQNFRYLSFKFFNFHIAGLTSSREKGRLISPFSRIMTGFYSKGTVPENRGSLRMTATFRIIFIVSDDTLI